MIPLAKVWLEGNFPQNFLLLINNLKYLTSMCRCAPWWTGGLL